MVADLCLTRFAAFLNPTTRPLVDRWCNVSQTARKAAGDENTASEIAQEVRHLSSWLTWYVSLLKPQGGLATKRGRRA